MNQNSIFAIKPYLWNGQWVFDDAERGLSREPFVGGVDSIISEVVAPIPNAKDGFLLLFSTVKFPGSTVALDWVEEDEGGNTYLWRGTEMHGWLCPALLKFYERAPKALYAQVKAIAA